MNIPDIDIDFADRRVAISILNTTQAMNLREDGKKHAHQSGVYFQDMPIDPFTGLASVDYKKAEDLGYFKFDFLNQSVYENVKDEEHLLKLLHEEPAWELLEESSFVDMLPHIKGHFNVVDSIKPKSIEDLAVVLALIRPGKKHLIGKDRTEIDRCIWERDDNDGYIFRKAHAVSYGALVVVRMNMLVAEMLEQL